jgi:uncharacterized membrane protein YgaE (UPF0421/DUF939 family)
MQYLFIGILIGIIINTYLLPIFDTLLEIYTYKMSEIATSSKIRAESMVKKYELKYPSIEESATNVVGFQYEQPEEIYEDDDLEDCKNKIGFKI